MIQPVNFYTYYWWKLIFGEVSGLSFYIIHRKLPLNLSPLNVALRYRNLSLLNAALRCHSALRYPLIEELVVPNHLLG